MKTERRPLKKIASEEQVSQLADLFRLMGDTSRLRIILTCLHTPINVSDIAEKLDLSQSLVSHHLRLLRGENHCAACYYGIVAPMRRWIIRDLPAVLRAVVTAVPKSD